MLLLPLHHGDEGSSAGFDWVDALVVLGVLALLAGVGLLAWKLVQRRRYG